MINKNLLYSTGNYINIFQKPIKEKNLNTHTHTHTHTHTYIYIYITESLCCITETNTTLQINYTPIKGKVKKVNLILCIFYNIRINIFSKI